MPAFNMYQWRSLVFEYLPTSSRTPSITTNAQILFSFVDSFVPYPEFSEKRIYKNYEGTMTAKASTPLLFRPRSMIMHNRFKTLDWDKINTNQELDEYFAGYFYAAITDTNFGDNLPRGELWVHYTIDLYVPQLPKQVQLPWYTLIFDDSSATIVNQWGPTANVTSRNEYGTMAVGVIAPGNGQLELEVPPTQGNFIFCVGIFGSLAPASGSWQEPNIFAQPSSTTNIQPVNMLINNYAAGPPFVQSTRYRKRGTELTATWYNEQAFRLVDPNKPGLIIVAGGVRNTSGTLSFQYDIMPFNPALPIVPKPPLV